jgi:purine-binding chemotaxis protein CheW
MKNSASKSPSDNSPRLDPVSDGSEEALSPAELAEIWAKRAYALAEPPPAEADGETLNLLVFILNGERYGLEVAHVREIHSLSQITPVPRTPDFVVGIFSARGRLISLIDLRRFFGLAGTGLSDQSKIIVINDGEGDDLEIGLLSDEVVDVITVFQTDLEPALTTQSVGRAEFVRGITADMLVVLNVKTLLYDERLIVNQEVGTI